MGFALNGGHKIEIVSLSPGPGAQRDMHDNVLLHVEKYKTPDGQQMFSLRVEPRVRRKVL